MRGSNVALTLAMVLWLAGCAGGGGSITRYLLPGADAPPAAPSAGDHLLLIRPVQLPTYLAVEGIVLQLDTITFNAARDHQWATPLAHQLRQGLRERLATRLPRTRVVSDPEALAPDALVLQVEVDRFLGREDGYAEASGRWLLRDDEGKMLTERSFSATSPLQSDGYPALVHALGRSWDKVAEQISEAVRDQR